MAQAERFFSHFLTSVASIGADPEAEGSEDTRLLVSQALQFNAILTDRTST